MKQRLLVALIGLALAVGWVEPSQAQNKGVTVAAVPIYILAAAGIMSGCLGEARGSGQGLYDRSGFHVGVGGVFGQENFEIAGPSENSLGAGLRAGYRCSPRIAPEIQYEHFAGFDTDATGFTPNVDALLVTANSKMFLTTGRIQPFVVAGLGGMRVDHRQGTVMRFGGGADIYANENFAVTLSIAYIAPYEGVEAFDLIAYSFGVDYRF